MKTKGTISEETEQKLQEFMRKQLKIDELKTDRHFLLIIAKFKKISKPIS